MQTQQERFASARDTQTFCSPTHLTLTSTVVRARITKGMSFRGQISVVRQSHVLAGIHGAGLTHLLWLPRHAGRVALVEVYNTMDEFCFKDLAALGGVEYFTWSASEKSLHPDDPADLRPDTAKQQNYSPDPNEFVALMAKAIAYVRGDDAATTRGQREGHDDL